MPIYEYECNNCNTTFESVRSISDDDKDLKCPICGSSSVKKILSVFSSSSIHGCSSCASSNRGFT